MNELFKEIEDDIRSEQIDRLWRRLGKVMVGVSVVVVLVTIVVVVIQNHRQSEAMQQTSQFARGLDQLGLKDYKGAIATFASLSTNTGSPYYGMAMLRMAQAEEQSGDKEGAGKTYQMLAANGGTFGELARMQSDSGAIIMPDKHAPFYYSESEWRGWQLLKTGKKNEAIKQFTALRDDADAPFSLRQRMEEVVSAMNEEQAKGNP